MKELNRIEEIDKDDEIKDSDIDNEEEKLFYIIHRRKTYYKNSTLGRVYIDNVLFCYTLEDTVRGYGIKVKHHTAIPPSKAGYNISIRYSPKFKRDMLCLHSPDYPFSIIKNNIRFDYIYPHGGNDDTDTSGCILVGYKRTATKIYQSAEKELFELVKNKIEEGYIVKWVIINVIK